jgi:hypothetical protein
MMGTHRGSRCQTDSTLAGVYGLALPSLPIIYLEKRIKNPR